MTWNSLTVKHLVMAAMLVAGVAAVILSGGCAEHYAGGRLLSPRDASIAAYSVGQSYTTPAGAATGGELLNAGKGLNGPGHASNLALRESLFSELRGSTGPGEEVWVIARPGQAVARSDRDEIPGSGALVVERPGAAVGQEPGDLSRAIPVPLKHTSVKASITAYIATVDVTQQFHNPFDSKIEAVYVFPLPDNGAVNEFIMAIGERKIRGIIRERAEAEKIYHEARAQGYNAALMTQERPNIFTQRVANIEPGKAIDIHIRYFHTLSYMDGWYEFAFPMVVGPRFNPPHTEATGDGIGAVGRTQAGTSGQRTEVQYLRPNERSGHDISLAVELDAGVAIEELVCRSHQIRHTPVKEGKTQVALDAADSIPNKDFVLRYRVAGDRIKSNLLVQRDPKGGSSGGYFTLMIYPPADLKHLPRQPMEMVFVLDCSGSMEGYPIQKSKEAIRHALKSMNGQDTFQVINFSNSARQLGAAPLPVNERHVQAALNYVNGLNSEGGTMMIEGVKAALDFPASEGRQRVVAFLTDGYIGNEAEILGEMHKRMRGAKVFSFGIGSSVNRYLIESMARLGRGAVAYVGPNDDGAQVMDAFFQRISHPALTDVAIDFGGMRVREVFPKKLPDLYVGRPVLVVGRYEGEAPRMVRIRGRAGREELAMDVPVSGVASQWSPAASGIQGGAQENGQAVGGIAAVWARTQIQDLSDQLAHTNDPHGELPTQIKRVALDYSLLSAYTAFIAVDSSRRTEGATGTTVPVPVPTPQGVKYETTVRE